MEAAATERLRDEADQIEQEMQRLLAEMERATAKEHRGGQVQRFLELLKRRGEIARRALALFEELESERRARMSRAS
jgi:hypothetical protein